MTLTVVVTGASAGVGRAVARTFAERDRARIGLIARNAARLEQAAREIEARGGAALACPADVADADAVEEAAERVERVLGPIDVWVNCAMATLLAPFQRISPEEYRRVTEVTYLGCVHGTRSALERMRERDRGVIVQTGSALAYRAIPLQAPYCGAKHAIVGFTDSLRCELLHDHCRVQLSVVHLPAVNTPQFDWMRNRLPRRPQPLPPIFQPEVAAHAIHHAAHHPRRELWVGGSAVQAIVGQKLAPGLLDHVLARKGYRGQQTDEPARTRPDNLFDSVDDEVGAHGRFDRRAKSRSLALTATEHRPALLRGGLVMLGLGAAWWLARQRGRT
jgi:NAD(P)-dependent dehydrogenase (short-subunit alcohol dehydrogenase family)